MTGQSFSLPDLEKFRADVYCTILRSYSFQCFELATIPLILVYIIFRLSGVIWVGLGGAAPPLPQ